MGIRVHREFHRSFETLSDVERRAVAATIREHAVGTVTPGMRLHKVGAFLSISPNMDIRILSIRRGSDITYFYVGHHDEAYRWSARNAPIVGNDGPELLPLSVVLRVLDPTGKDAAIVTLPDILDRLAVARLSDDELLTAIEGLSPEWQEWFFRTHIEREIPRPSQPATGSFTTTISTDHELLAALSLPTPSWHIFLHPSQRFAVESKSSSIAISGPPGSGKTVILMNRFLNDSDDAAIKVFVTYSNGLVGHLRDLAGNRHQRFGYRVVFHSEFSRNPTTGSSGFVIGDDGGLVYVNQAGRRANIDEILIDEFQDTPRQTLEIVNAVLAAGKTRLVVAYDLEQTLFSSNSADVISFANRCQQQISLTYVYRSSREIMMSASTVASDLRSAIAHGAEPKRGIYGISGPPIVFLETSSMNDQVRCCSDIVEELEARYDQRELASIYVQHYNPSFSGKSAEEAALKNHPRLGAYYRFASTVKGLEFSAGVLFVSESYLRRRDVGRSGLDLRINTFYTAATRFRDELTVVYRKASPFAELIADAKVIRVQSSGS